ncbi:uncharacterized protein isoform X7 [Macaca fascicularis]|uniref:uncharacterized protein isoform X7 n=1 Tax=Macaca fascicularis TaxID=9541 RepID=UPI003D15B97B
MRPASARDPAPARPRLFVCLTPPRPARTGPALRAAFFVDPETDSPEPRSARTSTRKLSRQLWPNTKSGRWRCLCLPNAGPWSCRPPWMPTPLQVGIQHHDGSSWLNAAVTTWAQAVLPLQPQAAGTTGKKLSKLKNQLLFLNLQET